MNKTFVSVVLALVVSLGVSLTVALTAPHQSVVVREDGSQNAGSVSSPAIPSPWISWGDLVHWARRVNITASAQTLCSIQSPAATSTLTSFVVTVKNPMAVTDLIQMGWGTTRGSTSTLIASHALVSGNAMTLIATTGPTTTFGSNADEPNVVQPLTYFSVNISSSSVSASFTPTTHCSATFREVI